MRQTNDWQQHVHWQPVSRLGEQNKRVKAVISPVLLGGAVGSAIAHCNTMSFLWSLSCSPRYLSIGTSVGRCSDGSVAQLDTTPSSTQRGEQRWSTSQRWFQAAGSLTAWEGSSSRSQSLPEPWPLLDGCVAGRSNHHIRLILTLTEHHWAQAHTAYNQRVTSYNY